MKRWHRLWTIWILTRNIEVVIQALRMRHVTTVYEFVISGGHLRPMGSHTIIEWKGMEFEMLSHQLWALASLKSMAEHGWLLTRLDTDRYAVDLPSGDTFIVYRDTMASDLMVLHERFIEDEYGRFDVSNHLVLDVGANIGDSAIYFARMGAEVHAFEPFRQLYQRLLSNVERNHLSQQISCHQIGVGVCSGTTKGIYNPKESLSSAASSTASDSLHDIPSELETVQLVSLSEALAIAEAISGTHKPITLKLDCEGCEFDVVGHSESQAAFGHPRLRNIILEYHFRSPQMIIEAITSYGFYLSYHEAKGPVGLLYFSKEVS